MHRTLYRTASTLTLLLAAFFVAGAVYFASYGSYTITTLYLLGTAIAGVVALLTARAARGRVPLAVAYCLPPLLVAFFALMWLAL